MKLISLVLAPLLLLTGCAVDPYARFDRLRNFEGPEYGYVVASIGKTKLSVFDSTAVWFHQVGTGDDGSFSYAPKAFLGKSGASPRDIDSKEFEGTVVTKRLPPGRYQVYVARGVWYSGGTRIYSRSVSPSVTFDVGIGKISYVGRFIIGQAGTGATSEATLRIIDEHADDLAHAKARSQTLNTGEALILSIPTHY